MNKGYEKVLKNKKLDKDSNIKITKNDMGARIFVAFSSSDGKLVIQKSFQDTYDGNKLMEEFANSIKGINDIKKYFGLIKE